jgi:hypothetical protein
MAGRLTSTQRALLTGVTAAGVLIGAFAVGAAQGGDPAAAATASGRTLAVQPGTAAGADGASAAKITVTGTGAVSGTPDQLLLSMGVQTSDASVSAALQRANDAVRTVTAALARSGVRRSDIQTSGMSIQPQYAGNSALPTGYGPASRSRSPCAGWRPRAPRSVTRCGPAVTPPRWTASRST